MYADLHFLTFDNKMHRAENEEIEIYNFRSSDDEEDVIFGVPLGYGPSPYEYLNDDDPLTEFPINTNTNRVTRKSPKEEENIYSSEADKLMAELAADDSFCLESWRIPRPPQYRKPHKIDFDFRWMTEQKPKIYHKISKMIKSYMEQAKSQENQQPGKPVDLTKLKPKYACLLENLGSLIESYKDTS
ncbi:uncharacterized protein [Atheta coriaria]|uniref:uncharacterized protein n=1 Tax=Dalotia coriaria TaxID=877792 RepID=UPI0031F38830